MIVLVPVGEVAPNILESIRGALAEIFGEEAVIGEEVPLTEEFRDNVRGQYFAPFLLDCLPVAHPHSAVLGVADIDAYTPGLNFIFGQADRQDRLALICLKRLRQEFYGLSPNEGLFRERVLKEAVHELGHAYGLGHCHDPDCVMYFSNSLSDTDRKSRAFCDDCRGTVSPARG